MDFLKRVILLFTVSILMIFATALLVFSFNLVDWNLIYPHFYWAYHDDHFRIFVGSVAGTALFFTYLLYQFFSVNIHRDKIIAFDNPSGRVTLSLFAMEDLIKRLVTRLDEVKDAKVTITALRKKLTANVRLVLGSEVNIPEITSEIQTLVYKKIQDTIGIEEPINVTVYVGKIFPERVKDTADKKTLEEETLPFKGYRA